MWSLYVFSQYQGLPGKILEMGKISATPIPPPPHPIHHIKENGHVFNCWRVEAERSLKNCVQVIDFYCCWIWGLARNGI